VADRSGGHAHFIGEYARQSTKFSRWHRHNEVERGAVAAEGGAIAKVMGVPNVIFETSKRPSSSYSSHVLLLICYGV
jgi:hypothetical protein